MSSDVENDTAIMRAARRLLWVVGAATAIMLSLYLAARLGLQLGGARVEYEPHEAAGRTSQAIGDIGMVLLVIALGRLAQMLRAIGRGELFSATVIRRFRGFAFWLLLMAIVDLAGPLLAEMFVRRAGDPVRLIIDFRQVLTVGVTLLLFLLARLFERARQIDEENREFV
jgi:Protein of unknown function (DUF2975)